jgi:hypothetical protein
MSLLSAGTDRCAERLSFLVVSSENQRSTRFSHEELVGVKCKTGVRQQPAFDRGCLVSRAVVKHDVHVQIGGDLTVQGLQKLLELDRAMA